MQPEVQSYQHALSVWERFHSHARHPFPEEHTLASGTLSEQRIEELLRRLPPGESRPAAIGFFIRSAANWNPLRQCTFLGEFIQGPSRVERRLLEAAAKGALKPSHKRPVTVEEFPSRIWKRAHASGSPARLVNAACLAFHAMIHLHEMHEDDTDLEDLLTFRIPSGDLPVVIDLAALSPMHVGGLKQSIIDRLGHEIRTGRFEISIEEMTAIKAWVLADTEEGPPLIRKLAAEAKATLEKHYQTGSLRDHHHTRRLGRLMFRFGLRRLSAQCAKALGYSPWEMGWQHQTISGACHDRIRRMILRADSDADTWMREPALACSAMTIPLWLADGVARVPELVALFNRAEECPWVFPRLQPIYQWHLALAGNYKELRRIEQLAPDLAVGLSENSNPTRSSHP